MQLDDHEKQLAVISSLTQNGKLGEAAAAVGVSRQTLAAYCKTHPAFDERVKTARMRGRRVEHNVTREEPLVAMPVTELVTDAELLPGAPSVAAFISEVWDAAKDPDDRRAPVAMRMLGEIILGPLSRAQQRAEQRGEQTCVAPDAVGVLLELVNRGAPPADETP